MAIPHVKVVLLTVFALELQVPAMGAEKLRLNVKIIDRQNNETAYSYTVPGYVQSNSSTTANCVGVMNTASCNSSTTTTGTVRPSRSGGYSVQGATFTLLLPDGRATVVNCSSKYAPRGDYVNKRSCRQPMTDEIEVEFDGSNAKLKWPVSLDGKKFDSETYKIVGVLTKAQ